MTIEHPYAQLSGGTWLRGNLHAHSSRSDGDLEPQQVVDAYAARDHDFLMLSDHDICTTVDDYARWNNRGMLLIPGNEVTRDGVHLLHINAAERVEPSAERQGVIDRINAAGGLAVVNHPNWQAGYNHCPIELLHEWTGYAGLEIFNGAIGRMQGSSYALEKWDTLLTTGRRVWGFGNDDSHIQEDIGLGWNVVYVRERTCTAVVEALRCGRFYVSTGVVISDIQVHGDRIRIETLNAERIIASGRWSRRLKVEDASAIELTVPRDMPFVRFECWGRGERRAWTQPFFVNLHP